MILRSTYLSQKPAIFKTMTGLTVTLFDDLVCTPRQRRGYTLGVSAYPLKKVHQGHWSGLWRLSISRMP